VPRLVIAAAPAAITPTGGLLALATVMVLMPWRGSRRHAAACGAGVALLNAPWVIAGLLTTAGGASDPAGVGAFAARGENWSGPLGALAGTGGIWSAQATPDSRSSPLIPLATLGLLALAVLGFAVLRRRFPAGSAVRLGLLAAGCFALAVLGALPGTAGALRWLVAHAPGAGLLRDGQKFLAPYALLLVLCVALGVERLTARLEPVLAGVVLIGAMLAPVAVLPDLAVGGAGRLRPVEYPPDWQIVAARIADDPGDVLSLPFSAYRSYPWNPGRIVLDPLPRFVGADVITDDTLYVGDVAIAGESPRVAQVRQLLAAGRPVAQTGVRWVVVQHHSAGDVDPSFLADLDLAHNGPVLALYSNPAARPRPAPAEIRAGRWSVAGTMAAAAALVLISTAAALRHRRGLALGARQGGAQERPTAW
jgi:hypothetical protein